MARRPAPQGSEIPEQDLPGAGVFVHSANDKVKFSRLRCLIDTDGSVRHGGALLGARVVDSVDQARNPIDTELDDFGNSGIARKDVLRDSGTW